MAIRQRGSSWQVDVTVRGVRRTGTAKTEEEAKVLECDITKELLTSTPATKLEDGWTVGEAYRRVYDSEWKDTPHGMNQEKIWPRIKEHFGNDTPLKAITAGDIDNYVQKMKKNGKANGTINRHMSLLRCLFTHAMNIRDLSRVDTKPFIPFFRESIGRTRFFSVEEEKAITSHMRHLGHAEQADFVEFLIDTGARLESDALKLTWDCVDLSAGLIVFRNRKARNNTGIPMTRRVKEMLDKFKAIPGRDSIRVWPYKVWWIRGPWNRVATKLDKENDPEWILHTCRHTTASRLVQRGVPLASVKDFMGHKTLAMTLRYAHLSPTQLVACAAALEPQPEPQSDCNPPVAGAG